MSLKPGLIRESISALSKRADLSRYTRALMKIVRLSNSDDNLKREWQRNLRQLRALAYTSAKGTGRQREKLFEISRNKQVVNAMRYALSQEIDISIRGIEPSWIAVLYADGSRASIMETTRSTA